MAASFTAYDHFPAIFYDGTVDWDTDTIKLALVTSSYTPAGTHTQWADASANEVSSGDGYTTGGETLTGNAVSNTHCTANNVVWAALTKTFRYGVLYRSGTVNGLTDPLIGYILFDNTPADVSPSGESFTSEWASGNVVAF